MDVRTFIFFVLLPPLNFAHSVHVSGTIDQNKTFFYRKLPVTPSVRATINYVISYKQRSIVHKGRYPLMGIYTEFPKVNIDRHCSKIRYAQLRNENLHPHLKVGQYRTTTCELSAGDDIVNCSGRVTVQDYIPRNFYLSFGFHCDWQPGNSLKGLRYNITFSNQSNETNNCIGYRSLDMLGKCKTFYDKTTLPNLIGNEKIEQFMILGRAIRIYEAIAFMDGPCYKHLWEVACYITLPKCDPVTQQVTYPCREMCGDVINGCWKKIAAFVSRDLDVSTVSNWSRWIDCNYLPSIQGNIPCFYKPVTCDSPPDVTNGARLLEATQEDVYQLHDVVQYACVNETYEMIGTDSITCLYSGNWSHSPPKCLPVNKFGIESVYFVLLVISLLLLVVFIICMGIKYKRKTSPDLNEERIQLDNTLAQLIDNDEPLLPLKRQRESILSLDSVPLLKRNRTFDAFVVYHFDTDSDFVVDSLIPELKEARQLKLHIHSQDFQPGRNIEENIEEAIKSSNNAIVLVSTGFINSRWCMNEFSHCYIEHVEDPSFKLLVIMMEPGVNLTDLPPNMKKLVTEQTYLELTDPELFTKLARCLRPENDADVTDTD